MCLHRFLDIHSQKNKLQQQQQVVKSSQGYKFCFIYKITLNKTVTVHIPLKTPTTRYANDNKLDENENNYQLGNITIER
jgi:hypothetical protein